MRLKIKCHDKPLTFILEKFSEIKELCSYPEGTIFTWVGNHRWDIDCSVCREHKYSKIGFDWKRNASTYTIKAGKMSCLCSKAVRMPMELIKYKIYKEGTPSGMIPLSEDDVINYSSRIKCQCPVHNTVVITNVRSLLGYKYICESCFKDFKDSSGFRVNKGRLKDLDSLYIVRLSKDSESFIKIGRTFNPKQRMSYYKGKGYSVDIIDFYIDTHENICKKEVAVGKYLKEFSYQPLEPFNGSKQECYTQEFLNEY